MLPKNLLFFTFFTLTACGGSNEDPCPTGQVRIGDACIATMPDAGSDASVDISASEVCNGLDDDMDGETDEADPMLGESCGEDMGVCTVGMTVCTEGELVCNGVQAGEETCNGLDDNCDGVIDEDTLQDFFLDVDGDGYGSGDACNACAAEECGDGMWVTMDGDCDETCDTCYLGATEVCDELDNNCNTLVDEGEGVQVLLFVDTDGDGFGVGLGIPSCLDEEGSAPVGQSAEDGDCAPDDDRAFPGGSAYSTPIEGESGVGGDYDFNCDGEEEVGYPRCIQNSDGELDPVCRPTPGYCWASFAASPECGDRTIRSAVSGTIAIPGISDGVCRFSPEDFQPYDLECR
ncbi:MAG: hypothetical protein ACI9KE_005823 [Polyangiales bacterium]|jgi:hypothetical protein